MIDRTICLAAARSSGCPVTLIQGSENLIQTLKLQTLQQNKTLQLYVSLIFKSKFPVFDTFFTLFCIFYNKLKLWLFASTSNLTAMFAFQTANGLKWVITYEVKVLQSHYIFVEEIY